jgi:hypothetical protein
MPDFVYKNKSGVGLGNVLIHLSEICDYCVCLHDNVYDWELSNCIVLEGFTRVSHEGRQPDVPILINPQRTFEIHSKIRKFVRPTPCMTEMIEKHKHLLEGVSTSVHIRRGSYSKDSTQHKGGKSLEPEYYHASDEALLIFEKIIENEKGKVYVASDSREVKQTITSKFGNKIRTIDTAFACTAFQDGTNTQTIKTLQDVYLEWFLISMCPKVYVTGGRRDLVGFSTFGYTAAIYGKKPFEIIFNP